MVERGPTIAVDVGFEGPRPLPSPEGASVPPVHDASQQQLAQVVPNFKRVPALIDTGALDSCIDEDLAQELGLPLIDEAECSGVAGRHRLNVYLGYIRIPTLGQVRAGRFTGAKLHGGGQIHKALIGRTQLVGMILIYDGRTGSASLSL